MFTGIVQQIAVVSSLEPLAEGARLWIETSTALNHVVMGESIAIDGGCLTVVEQKKKGKLLAFDLSAETLKKTKMAFYQKGTHVNLERALRVGDSLGGHFVSGHIDLTTKVLDVLTQSGFSELTVAIPKGREGELIEKGSVVLDGISLTVWGLSKKSFKVSVIPHTLNNTTLQYWKKGEVINLETDLFAKYAAKQLKFLRLKKAASRG